MVDTFPRSFPVNNIKAGSLVVVTLAHVRGMASDTAAAVVEEAYGDTLGTLRVRLTGLVPAPYTPGMVLAVNGDKAKAAGW